MNIKYPEHIYALINDGLAAALGRIGDYTPAMSNVAFFDAVQSHAVLAQRNMLENNPAYRQFLPYMIISRIVNGVKQYLVYLRVKGSGEERLFGNASIGVGGHVDANDTVLDSSSVLRFRDVIDMAHTRELYEELRYGSAGTLPEDHVNMESMSPAEGIRLSSFITNNTVVHGYILENPEIGEDGKIPVGLVHMAYVMEVALGDSITASCHEAAMETVGWMTLEQLQISTLKFENWSEILIGNLAEMEATQVRLVAEEKVRREAEFNAGKDGVIDASVYGGDCQSPAVQ
jgi:predicted NUDIX family phosphoesterase